MALDVSIIVLNYNHPEVITRLLKSFPMTSGVSYELVVVDNGSQPAVVEMLKGFHADGTITTLVPEPVNHFFSEGNNIGVRHSNPESRYILLLNSDMEILHPEWLKKMTEWMEGTPEICPYTWSDKAQPPSPGPRDVVSYGWSWDADVPGCARPEGSCCMIRRTMWREISPDFPFHSGIEEMLASIARDGGIVGSLSQYAPYVHHHGGGSEAPLMRNQIVNKRVANMKEWWSHGRPPEPLDFTFGPDGIAAPVSGPDEHRSYIQW